MRSSQEPLARFAALDGLRGVFALMVALHHSHLATHLAGARWVEAAYLAVDFFFVLSGFVIAHAALPKLNDGGSAVSFAVRRFGRVWPLHMVMLCAFVALESIKWLVWSRSHVPMAVLPFGTERNSLMAIPAHVLLIHSLHVFSGLTWNEPSWSISAEFYTYLLFAVVAVGVWRWRWLVSLLLVCASAAFLVRHADTINVTADYGFVRCVFGFFLGHLVYCLHQNARVHLRWAARVEICIAVLILIFMSWSFDKAWSFLSPVVFAGAIWLFAREAGPLSWMLRLRPMQWLGERSYSVYMVHMFLYACLDRGIRMVGPKLIRGFTLQERPLAFGSVWLMDCVLLTIILSTLVLAALTYRYVELPGQRLFQRFAKSLERRRAHTSTVVRPQPYPAVD